jgi:hypothetical protein
VEEMRNAYKVVFGKSEGKRPCENFCVNGMIIKINLTEGAVERC